MGYGPNEQRWAPLSAATDGGDVMVVEQLSEAGRSELSHRPCSLLVAPAQALVGMNVFLSNQATKHRLLEKGYHRTSPRDDP